MTRLLVSEIHPVNLPLFWFLSFFVEVEACRIQLICRPVLGGRIKLVDYGQHLFWNDTHCLRSNVTQVWERLLERFPTGHWNMRHRGLSLDFTTKAKQELAFHLERFMALQEICHRIGEETSIYIVDSPQFRYLKKLDSSGELSKYRSIAVISWVNVLLDYLFSYLHNIAQLVRLLMAMSTACLSRDREQLPDAVDISFLWEPIDPNELTVDSKRRCFSWVLDGDRITKNNVLFVLPNSADSESRPDLYSGGYQAFTIRRLHRAIPVSILLGSVVDLLIFLFRYLLPIPRGLASIQKGYYFARVVRMKPVAEHFGFTCYVTSMSSLGSEDPATVYLNSIGVETIMYSYSANGYPFGNGICRCGFRDVFFANVMASRMLVWHKDFQQFIQGHPQVSTNVEVIGPLMAGDENVCQSPKSVVRSDIGIERPAANGHLRYISVFDMAAISKEHPVANSRFPDCYTEGYNLAFLRDTLRLLEDFEDIAIVFKPQRSLTDPRFTYAQEFHKLLADLRNNERGLVMEQDINPWIPIAIADLCIAMPFTSPALAAMHHGIPALFHDPTGEAIHHRYGSISHLITHNYEELGEQIQKTLFESPGNNISKEDLWEETRDFIGQYPGTSSSDRFRHILYEISNREVSR